MSFRGIGFVQLDLSRHTFVIYSPQGYWNAFERYCKETYKQYQLFQRQMRGPYMPLAVETYPCVVMYKCDPVSDFVTALCYSVEAYEKRLLDRINEVRDIV